MPWGPNTKASLRQGARSIALSLPTRRSLKGFGRRRGDGPQQAEQSPCAVGDLSKRPRHSERIIRVVLKASARPPSEASKVNMTTSILKRLPRLQNHLLSGRVRRNASLGQQTPVSQAFEPRRKREHGLRVGSCDHCRTHLNPPIPGKISRKNFVKPRRS